MHQTSNTHMSSSAFSSLHRIFSRKPTASTAAAATATSPIFKPDNGPKPTTSKPKNLTIPIKSSSSNEIETLVSQFRKRSESQWFRKNNHPYKAMVRRLAAARQFHHIESIIEHQKKYENDITREPFVVRLITLYGKSKMFEHAHKLFDQMPQLNCNRTILSFNALLSACANSEKYEKMAELFRELPVKLSIKPDKVSYNIVIKTFVDMGAIDAAIVVICEMEKDGCEPDSITFNTIIDALYKKKQLAEAEKVWEQMESKNIAPDVRSYNAKLRGLFAVKRVSEAVDVIIEMKGKGIKPDICTYNWLIQGFCKENNLVEVKKWYGEIFKNEIRPDYFTFSIAVPFACEAGDFGFAYKLSKEALCMKGVVGVDVLQRVVDGLVKDSKIEKAGEIVELEKLNSAR